MTNKRLMSLRAAYLKKVRKMAETGDPLWVIRSKMTGVPLFEESGEPVDITNLSEDRWHRYREHGSADEGTEAYIPHTANGSGVASTEGKSP